MNTALNDRRLVLERVFDAPVETIWRCWTEPALLMRWFTPKPYETVACEIDLRPGGRFRTAMKGPDGFASDETGVFLEVIANRRLVFTDAYKPGWEPSEAPFMTSVIDFADEGGKTRYVATALHWTVADRKRHEEMGFHEGWGAAADQLAALAASL